jgi:hypothetical protein
MKKQLESELISIAHKILKLTGRDDLGKMQTEIELLYQKITILKFIEGHHNGHLPESIKEDLSFFEPLEPVSSGPAQKEVNVEKELEPTLLTEQLEEKTTPAVEDVEREPTQAPETNEQQTLEEASKNASSLVENTNTSSDALEHDLSELSPSYAQLPIFDAIDEATQQTSLNDQLKPQGFQIGLNDRLAFVKSLFENSNEDYERVLSQLITLDSYEEAKNLLDSIIKPDYNNWEGQEDVESRFLEIIENNFN